MKITRQQVYDLLDSYVQGGHWNLVVYEDSCDIIEHHFPEHGLTDYELEEYTYEWLNDVEE